jgi:hypothetical protein
MDMKDDEGREREDRFGDGDIVGRDGLELEGDGSQVGGAGRRASKAGGLSSLHLCFAVNSKLYVAWAVRDAEEMNEQLRLASDAHAMINILYVPLLDMGVPYFYNGTSIRVHLCQEGRTLGNVECWVRDNVLLADGNRSLSVL